jgi:hypothetical protein
LVEPGETPSRAALMTEQETFIGGELVAVRWKQWRIYFTHVHRVASGRSENRFLGQRSFEAYLDQAA